jgi:hypothetical protein
MQSGSGRVEVARRRITTRLKYLEIFLAFKSAFSNQSGQWSGKIGGVQSHANETQWMENFMPEKVDQSNQRGTNGHQKGNFDGNPKLKI